jgi:shikimate kinase
VTHLLLVGLMGSGKSTAARRLGAAMQRRVVDLDTEVETAAGCSIPELFATEGEDGFRRRETEALTSALHEPDPLVIATGGGVVVRAENRARMRNTPGVRVVWLDASPEALVARVGRGSSTRPLLADDPEGVLRRLHAERHAWYGEVAHHRVATDGRSLDEVLAAITRFLNDECTARGDQHP